MNNYRNITRKACFGDIVRGGVLALFDFIFLSKQKPAVRSNVRLAGFFVS